MGELQGEEMKFYEGGIEMSKWIPESLKCKTCGVVIDSTHFYIFQYKDGTVDCFKCGETKEENKKW